MSALGVTAAIVIFLSTIVAFSLSRTLKLGSFMHTVPYILVVIGVGLGKLAPDSSDIVWFGLLMALITLVIHGAVVYELRKSSRKE